MVNDPLTVRSLLMIDVTDELVTVKLFNALPVIVPTLLNNWALVPLKVVTFAALTPGVYVPPAAIVKLWPTARSIELVLRFSVLLLPIVKSFKMFKTVSPEVGMVH